MATRVVSRSPRPRARPRPAPRPTATAPHTTRTSVNGSRSCTAGELARVGAHQPGRPLGAGVRAAAVSACEQTSGTCPAPGCARRRPARRRPRSPTPGAGGDQHLVAAGRGRASPTWPGPRTASRRTATSPGWTSSRSAGRRRGRHAARHRQLRRTGVGVADGHDGVGERGQRRPGDDAHRLPGLQTQRMTRTRRDLADDRQHGGRLLTRAGRGRRCGSRSRRPPPGRSRATGGRDHLLGAAQPVRLGDRHTHRWRSDRTGQDQGELLVDRPLRHYAPTV